MSKGPIYGVELLDVLPLGTGSMRQALPSRSDLERVREVSERTVAGYEVVLAHYYRQQAEIERLRATSDCPRCDKPTDRFTLERVGMCQQCAAEKIDRLEDIIRDNLDHSADGVLLCKYKGPLHCPKCGSVVREEYDICYCESCQNPDDFGQSPLPLFYSQCFVDPSNRGDG